MDRPLFDFNKELLFGEFGSLVGAPSIAFLVSNFTNNESYVSFSAVIGGIIGASLFWLVTRIMDQKQRKLFSVNSLTEDLLFFTPAALLLAMIVYYPTLFLLSKRFLITEHNVFLSVVFAQVIAYALFLIAINAYRLLLWKFAKKKL